MRIRVTVHNKDTEQGDRGTRGMERTQEGQGRGERPWGSTKAVTSSSQLQKPPHTTRSGELQAHTHVTNRFLSNQRIATLTPLPTPLFTLSPLPSLSTLPLHLPSPLFASRSPHSLARNVTHSLTSYPVIQQISSTLVLVHSSTSSTYSSHTPPILHSRPSLPSQLTHEYYSFHQSFHLLPPLTKLP